MSEQTEFTLINSAVDLPDDILMAIGRLTVSFGQLEYVLALTIIRTSSTGMTFGEAHEKAKTLVSIHALAERAYEEFQRRTLDQNIEARLHALVGDVRDLARRWADVKHALWGTGEDGRVNWVARGQQAPVDTELLAQLDEEICATRDALNQLTSPSGVTGVLSAAPFRP